MSHWVYMCDRCGAVKCFLGRIDGFDGTYHDDSWRGLQFGELQGAWERGEINITWFCRKCLSDLLGVRPKCIGRDDRKRRLNKKRGRR